MDALTGFDPFQLVNEIIVLVAVSVVAVLTWKFRARVMVALTGDDRIHGTPLDFVWFSCFRCCGTCNGDWTRVLTKGPCCPRRIVCPGLCPSGVDCRGRNLVRMFGQCLGITPYTVEIKNIVVGDLPWAKRADFYLNVECAANPPMMSSLAQDKSPKVCHFPEVITLRLRWSPLEQSVRISVKELNVLGSTELCQVYISAMSILDWSDDPGERMKRFEMKPIDGALEPETPPWILVEFDQPTEARDLEHFHGNCSTVRTATRDGHYQDLNVEAFKHEYTLLDSSGHAIQEPLEADLRDIACLKSCVSSVTGLCNIMVAALFVSWITLRSYVWSCYHNFRLLTVATMRNATLPIGHAALKGLIGQCKLEVEGTGAAPGIPCRPNHEQVLATCRQPSEGGYFLGEQPYPTALQGVLSEWAGTDKKGIPCFVGVCQVRDELMKYDREVIGGFVLLVLLACVFRSCSNRLIRQRKSRRQRERAEDTKKINAEAWTKTRGRSPGP